MVSFIPPSKDKLLRSMKPLIPEPRHRVPPKGVTSGISFRDLPAPSLCAIRKICEHYEAKCSGQYSSLASRYVLQMGNEIRTQIGAIAKNRNDEINVFCLENDVYASHPSYKSGEDNFSDDVTQIKERQIKDRHSSNDASIATLEKEMNEYKRAEFEAKNELKQMKENAAKKLEQKIQEYKEKMQVNLLHYKNSLELIKRTHKQELKNAAAEIIQVKSDARIVIDFIRRKANEAIAEETSKNATQKKEIMESIKFKELQMKKSFNGHLELFEEQVKDIVRGEKLSFHTEMARTSATLGPRIPKPARDISLLSNSSVIGEGEVLSDDSIPTEDSRTNSMKDAKDNLSANENKLLKFRIKQLEQWTETLAIALRNGAAVKELNDNPSPLRDKVVSCKKDAEEERLFIPRSPQKLYNVLDDTSKTHNSPFKLVPPSPPSPQNIQPKIRWKW